LSLLRRSGVRLLLRHPVQLLLAILGVTLGVAMTLALDLGIRAAREGFRVSSETVAGRATHQLLLPGGVLPDSLVALLRREGEGWAVAPILDRWVGTPLLPGRPLRLLGVDPFAEAPFRSLLGGGDELGGVNAADLLVTIGGVVLSREMAGELGVELGGTFPIELSGRESSLQVVAIIELLDDWSRQGARDLLLVDVAEAQGLFGGAPGLDRIDLILPEGVSLPAGLLPPGVVVEEGGARQGSMLEMLRAFELNLQALGLLGLVFGVFLIYNAMTFTVLLRRRTLGLFRALGVPGDRLLRTVLGEALALGAAGSLLGVPLGILLGRGLVDLVTRTINDLYFTLAVGGVPLPPEAILRSVALGVGTTLLAALPPALEAGRSAPVAVLSRSALEERQRRSVRRGVWVGALLLLVGLSLLLPPGLFTAFTGLFAIVVGMALLTPWATILGMNLLRPLLRRWGGVLGAMAARGVVTSLSRTAPAMMALVLAVGVTVGLGAMIESFRGSVVRWLDVTLQADLYLTAPGAPGARTGGALPSELPDRVRTLPGVAGISERREIELAVAGPLFGVRLATLRLDPSVSAGFEILEAAIGDPIQAFLRGEGILVSEPLATRLRLRAGDELLLPAQFGEQRVQILAIHRDYASDRGSITLPPQLYRAGWGDPTPTALGVHLEAGADPMEVTQAIRAAAGGEGLLQVRSDGEIRALSLEVFDRTFAITRALRLLAFLVAFLAVLAALMALQLERTREFGVLRANGMTPGQGWGLILTQTGLMGGVAGVLAIPVGGVLAAIMIFVVNRRSFGWTMQLELGIPLILQTLALGLLGAFLAGIYPASRVARLSPAEALRSE